MLKKILFRADGNSTTGLGHLYRMFSVVEMINNDYEFIFLTKETSTTKIIPSRYNIETIPSNITVDQEPEWININFDKELYTIVADGYQFTTDYQKRIKEYGFLLVYIDDLASEYMYADLVINHSPCLKESDYKTEPYTKLALGTKFALLRPSFNDIAKKTRLISTIDTVFVCFGGADPTDMTLKAVIALLHLKKINVVIGGAYTHSSIFNYAKKYPDKIKLYKNLSEDNLIKVMKESDFAIAPASTILYELCCVKMPIISGYYVDNQKNIYNGLVKLNVVFGAGNFIDTSTLDFKMLINQLIENRNTQFYLNNQSNLFDGNSSTRILGCINSLHLSFRKANEKDMLRVFEWSNDNLVRQNSYNTDSINMQDHQSWFVNKVYDPNTLFLIGLINNKPAGLVRYEIDLDHSVISIVISSKYRRQGLATSFLKLAANEYFKTFEKPINAYIKKSNIASKKSFEKASYKYFKDEIIKGNRSFVYKLEKPNV